MTNEYYQELKRYLNHNLTNEKKKIGVRKLNEEFEQVKMLFGEYLKEKILQKFDFVNLNGNKSHLLDNFDIKYKGLYADPHSK